jgi:glycosyltransferase involved in cell wall biosynthesis
VTDLRTRKIVIAATEMSTGGLGSYLTNLTEGLTSRNWDIHLVSTNVSGDLFTRMNNFATCHDLSGHPLSKEKIFMTAELINSIAPKILLINNCSLVHYTLPLLGNKTKPVAVLHSNDDRFYKTAAFCGRRIFRWIAPTQGVAERCETYLPKGRRKSVRTIPHGIDTALFSVRKDRERQIRRNICFVGFIAENKGADLLPDIFLKVSRAHADIQFTIAGQGPLEQNLESRCKENGTIDKCIFTGGVNREKIAAILHGSGILILPTRIEGFGLSIIEAMMSGTVPVVSRIRGVTDDIVSDGVNGLLIEPDDTEGFADAIANLLKNPERLNSMSEAARETAIRKYSVDKMLDSYETLFAEDDDRENLPRRGTAGWFSEAIREKINNGLDRRWLFERTKGIWRQSIRRKTDAQKADTGKTP